MTKTLKVRLAIFIVAIASAVLLLVWAAFDSWQQSEVLRDRLTTVQLESFRIANGFQQSLQQLNNLLLRFAIGREQKDWLEFETRRTQLDHWIDDQRPHLTTERERLGLDEINRAYDGYMNAASNLAAHVLIAGR